MSAMMMRMTLHCVYFCLCVLFVLFVGAESQRPPVVGILAQPLRNDADHSHYIAASYVKWCEAGGATTVAVPYNSTDDTVYDDILAQVDGLLLPGGAAPISQGVIKLLDKIQQLDRYFPVFGTCLGFEFLIQYATGEPLESGFQASNVSWPLEQVKSREMYDYNSPVYTAATKHNITFNNHVQGIRPDVFMNDPNLSTKWQITSINHDERGIPFVSTIEPLDPETLPWYGVQYHPEKNAFEYGVNKYNQPYEVIDHSATGVQFSFALAQFWIDKVRRAADERQQATLSKSLPPLYTFPVRPGSAFEQIFLIPKDYPTATTKMAQVVSSPKTRQQRRRQQGDSPLRGRMHHKTIVRKVTAKMEKQRKRLRTRT